MNGSEVRRGCVSLMLSVQYCRRALPLGWLVISGEKGHFSQEKHIELLSAVQALIPAAADVIFLGDGEFDSTKLQERLEDLGWKYACRTSCNTILFDGEEFSFQDLLLQPDMCPSIAEVSLYANAIDLFSLWLGGASSIKSQSAWSPTWTGWKRSATGIKDASKLRLSFPTRSAEASIYTRAMLQTPRVW
jgi:hypothetical protein